MKFGNWFQDFTKNIDTEHAAKKAAITLSGLVACKLLVDYVKNYNKERKVLNFLSKYPEPFKGETIENCEVQESGLLSLLFPCRLRKFAL